jgi:predicted Zn-dependent protease
MSRFVFRLVWLAGVALLGGCVTPGTTVDSPEHRAAGGAAAQPVYATALLQPGVRPARASLEGSMWMRADNAESIIRTGGGVIRDDALNAYVRGLVCKLAGPHCSSIRTYVVRVPDFNASMMPNGVMQVWTGLLLRARNEAQLATVLGHEIGHYLQRHSVKRAEDLHTKTNALIFLQMASVAAGVPAAGDLMGLATAGAIAAFSREHETEADDVGLRLLVEHGYDPREAAKVWAQLLAETKADKNFGRGSVFFASHPPPEDRSARLSRMAADAVPGMAGIDAGRDRFLAVVGPHRASFLQDEINLRRFERAEVLFQQLAEDGANLGEVRLFQGEVHRLRNDKTDNEKALGFYRQALAEPSHPAVVHRSLGQVLHRMGRTAEAKEAFRRYLALAPDASDRDLIQMMIGT